MLTAGPIIYTIGHILGIVGSLMIIVTISRSNLIYRHRSYKLVLSLAVADGLQLCMMTALWSQVGSVATHLYWVDALTLATLTLIQALAIGQVNWIERRLSPSRVNWILVLTWFLPAIFSIPLLPWLDFARMVHSFEEESWIPIETGWGKLGNAILGVAHFLGVAAICVVCIVADVMIVRKVRDAKKNANERRSSASGAQQRRQNELASLGVQFCFTNLVYITHLILFLILCLLDSDAYLRNKVILLIYEVVSAAVYGGNFYLYVLCNATFRAEVIGVALRRRLETPSRSSQQR